MSHIQRAPRGAKPGGSPLQQDLRSQMERFYGVGLGHVRVHSDQISRSRADDIGARAFTVGSDVFMGTDGLRATGADRSGLMAHEVAHTLQQGRGGTALQASSDNPRHGARQHEREANRMASDFNRFLTAGTGTQPQSPRAARLLSPAPAGAVQMAGIDTHYGTFKDERYEPLTDSANKETGMELYLKFEPGTAVDATKIALVQIAKGVRNGVLNEDGIRGQHQVKSGSAKGYMVDQRDTHPSPLYATGSNLNTGGDLSKLEDYTTSPVTQVNNPPKAGEKNYSGWGDHGYRYHDGTDWIKKDAELVDAAEWRRAGDDSSMTFETAALAIEGRQKGTYYGSVTWGWERDKSGVFKTYPISLGSKGVPSHNFMEAARVWNDSRSTFAAKTKADATLFSQKSGPMGTIPSGTLLKLTGQSAYGDGQYFYETDYNGDVGWVSNNDLTEYTIGEETADLPVEEIFRTTGAIKEAPPTGNSGITPPQNPVELPAGTRVRIIVKPSEGKPGMLGVVDGTLTGLSVSITEDQMKLLGPDS